ncbi:MAG: ABC transporter substrate-binding protein [Sneathiella sp.]|nr:MAG: ABC transporter substrate-binding protein [Sneathiella sp.]
MCLFVLPLLPLSARAEKGVHDDEIIFGQTAAFEGPSAALGLGMRDGILAAFNEANQKGGIHGRKLVLKSYDDGYNPGRAIENANRLIEKDEVFALIGGVGTPTAKAVQPTTTEQDIPFIGPFTGAAFLRNPDFRNVVNIRASYEQETEAWIEHLTKDLGITRIAIFYQDDSFGRAGLKGVSEALKRRNMEAVAEGKYMRNTTAVKRALLSIRDGEPQAVAMIGAYKASAAFIKLARSLDMDVIFLNMSFVGTKALSSELGGDGSGVFVTQVVPSPDDDAIPLMADYRRAMDASDPGAEIGFVSLEGYIVGRLAVAVLEQLGQMPSRATFLSQIGQQKEFDLGGLELFFGAGDNQGSDRVFLTEILAHGRVRTLDRLPK